MMTQDDFKKYYNEYAKKLTNYLVANQVEYAKACDIVQESFIRLWNKRNDLQEDTSISAYVFQIAKNLRIDYLRAEKFSVVVDVDDHPDEFIDETEPTSASDSAILRKRIKQALAEIPADLAQAYTMYQLADLSIKEIAKQLSISESNVKVRIYRAREKLAELLKDLR